MFILPSALGDDDGGNESQLGITFGAVDGATEELAPARVGLAVVHHEGVIYQAPIDAEGERLAIDRAGIDYARLAQRSPRDDDGCTPDGVVNDLATAEIRDRIGDALAVDGNSDYGAGFADLLTHVGGGNVDGIEDGGNEVAGDDANYRGGATICELSASATGRRVGNRRGRWGRSYCWSGG